MTFKERAILAKKLLLKQRPVTYEEAIEQVIRLKTRHNIGISKDKKKYPRNEP